MNEPRLINICNIVELHIDQIPAIAVIILNQRSLMHSSVLIKSEAKNIIMPQSKASTPVIAGNECLAKRYYIRALLVPL